MPLTRENVAPNISPPLQGLWRVLTKTTSLSRLKSTFFSKSVVTAENPAPFHQALHRDF